MPTTPALAGRLAALARAAAAGGDAEAGAGAEVLADRADGTVVAVGGVVAKAHAPAEDGRAGELSVRLGVAAHPRLRGVLLPPLMPGATGDPGGLPDAAGRSGGRPGPGVPAPRSPEEHGPGGAGGIGPVRLDGYPDRPATLWPRGAPVDPDDPGAVPWETAGTLLARLHRVPAGALADRLPGPLPPTRGPEKAARAMARMRAALRDGRGGRRGRGGPGAVDPALAEAAEAAEAAWATLPAWCRGEEPAVLCAAGTVCHGDFHLGQLVRRPVSGGDGSWLLIDVDDLGLGTPAWDLARPAAWYATGLLHASAWDRFLGAYQDATGTSDLDPWPVLDAPARALTVQTAALAVAKAHAARRALDAAETACAQACARIADAPVRTGGRNRP